LYFNIHLKDKSLLTHDASEGKQVCSVYFNSITNLQCLTATLPQLQAVSHAT